MSDLRYEINDWLIDYAYYLVHEEISDEEVYRLSGARDKFFHKNYFKFLLFSNVMIGELGGCGTYCSPESENLKEILEMIFLPAEKIN